MYTNQNSSVICQFYLTFDYSWVRSIKIRKIIPTYVIVLKKSIIHTYLVCETFYNAQIKLRGAKCNFPHSIVNS
jgi:hypothetical protein